VESMTSTDVGLTVPEAARRLGMDGADVYRLIFRGLLAGKPGADGAVYVTDKAVQEYLSQVSDEPGTHSP
jgi:hypothetical protein